eukprot:6492785-Amphidinium_carterae.1
MLANTLERYLIRMPRLSWFRLCPLMFSLWSVTAGNTLGKGPRHTSSTVVVSAGACWPGFSLQPPMCFCKTNAIASGPPARSNVQPFCCSMRRMQHEHRAARTHPCNYPLIPKVSSHNPSTTPAAPRRRGVSAEALQACPL